jgi:hypothetical protein
MISHIEGIAYALQTKGDEIQTIPSHQELANRELLFPASSLFPFDSSPLFFRAYHSPSVTCTLRASSEGATFPVFFPVSRESWQKMVRVRLHPPPVKLNPTAEVALRLVEEFD